MGADNSVELARPFSDLTKWPKNRVDSVVKAYHEGEYDFGIDYNVVMSITGYDIEEAKELLTVHSKNDSGIVNAVTLLISIIALGNTENRNELGRAENIFDLMDFNNAAKITFDELTILLLCIGASFSFILEGNLPEELVLSREQKIMTYAKFVYEVLKKRSNSMITKEEFIRFFREQYLLQGVNSMNDIFRKLTADPSVEKETKEEEEEENKGEDNKTSPSKDNKQQKQKGKK